MYILALPYIAAAAEHKDNTSATPTTTTILVAWKVTPTARPADTSKDTNDGDACNTSIKRLLL